MATTTQTKDHDLFDLEGAVERWTTASRKAGADYLDAYGKNVDRLADLGVKTAAATKLPIVTEIAEAQAKLARDVAHTYISTTREFIKA
jgi:hypothetical protein